MNLLALDTSTDACSVALYSNEQILVEHTLAPRKHAQLLLPMIEKLLAEAGLSPQTIDGVAFGCGPGSFTGVRIAAATAQGIAFGADVGVIPISSLNALAQGAYRLHGATHVLASLDARMGEVYWGSYALNDAQIMQLQNEEMVCAPEDVQLPVKDANNEWLLVGSGAQSYPDIIESKCSASLNSRFVADCWPSAQDVLSVALPLAMRGEFSNAEDGVPVYLRNKVALTEAERDQGKQL